MREGIPLARIDGGHNTKEADCPIRFSYRSNNTEVHQRVTNIQTINI